MAKLLRSYQFRLSLVYLAVFGGSLVLLLAFLYWATVGYMSRQTDATIEAEIQGLAEQYRRRGLAGLSTLLAERARYNQTSVYLLTDAKRKPLLGNLGRWPQGALEDDDWLTFKLPVSTDAGPEVRRARGRSFMLRGGFHLLVGRDIQELVALEQLLRRALAWGLVVTCLLGLAGALAMSRSVVRRIEAINQTTRRIMAGDLSRRVETSSGNDEFEELADNINAMLNRIQRLMDDVRRVSDNVAHDLRTPLTRLRNQLDQLAQSSRLTEDDRGVARTAIAEADALLTTFNALLRIARIEAGQRRERFQPLDLSSIAEDVLEFYEPLAEEKAVALEAGLVRGAWVSGDRDLLFQALANLVDNAVKYTPGGGRVRLWTGVETGQVSFGVEDTGPGIAPEDREKVLRRFYRLDNARSTPGNGLGLSLVSAVAQLHDATLTLGGGNGGLNIGLELTRLRRPPATPALTSGGRPAAIPALSAAD